MKEYKITSEYDSMRLDRYISKTARDLPKGAIMKMLRKGDIKLNGKKASGDVRLKEGDIVKIFAQTEDFSKTVKVDMSDKPINVLYEDEYLLVVDKPAGIKTQSSQKGEDCLNSRVCNYLKDLINETEGRFIPGAPSRLDTNTSGIVCYAKTQRGAASLSKIFSESDVKKTYLTLCYGILEKNSKFEDYAVKDSLENKMVKASKDEKDSVKMITIFDPVGYYILNNGKMRKVDLESAKANIKNAFTLIEATLITGKTHQIRSSLSFHGLYVAGDLKYGDQKINQKLRDTFGLSRQFLHCHRISFPLWYDTSSIKVTSPLAKDLSVMIDEL